MSPLPYHHVDHHVGDKIRHLRFVRHMTQQQLAEAVGVRPPQIQKYETGFNRISASRLWDIAIAFGVTIEYFFEGLKDGDDAVNSATQELLMDKDAQELLEFIAKIPKAQRYRLLELAETLKPAE